MNQGWGNGRIYLLCRPEVQPLPAWCVPAALSAPEEGNKLVFITSDGTSLVSDLFLTHHVTLDIG